ncbi:MAG: GspH/FimT family pseudopilin [Pararobbsia sp.]
MAARARAPARTRRAARGFTLIEMLVVLVIAGILVAVASLALTRNPRTDLAEEGQRLALAFETASDDAQLRGAPLAWAPVSGGYRFFARERDGSWRALTDDPLLQPRAWTTEVSKVGIRYPGLRDAQTHDRVVFGVEAIDVPVTITLYGPSAEVSVVGTGNGRYAVQ